MTFSTVLPLVISDTHPFDDGSVERPHRYRFPIRACVFVVCLSHEAFCLQLFVVS